MTTKPTVSKGALRAAKEILKALIVFTEKPVISTELEEAIIGAAKIIHHETRQDDWWELLDLAEEARSILVGSEYTSQFSLSMKLQAAIEKIKEEG